MQRKKSNQREIVPAINLSEDTYRVIFFTLDSLIVFLMMLSPLIWILRDGLGPDATDSSGFDALGCFFMTFYFGPILIIIFALRLSAGICKRHHDNWEQTGCS